ncbi:cysteine--tRNA ligase [Candidatus Dojkabacteria bacterium]|nr:cysteine--tRNA ligase [Candidatus Dojkabacteria bacterium]
MLRIFNTLTKSLEEFKPLNDNKVTFYHCGPTVYWVQQIGNLRAMTMADLIRRTLMYMDYDVKFARNYTDVGHLTGDNLGDADTGEDRMEKGAKREGLSPQQIADKYISIFEKDIKSLNIIEPDFKPRATEYVKEMIVIVEKLLKDGFAYSTPKAIYFDISKFSDYNKLNHQNIEKNIKGSGFGSVEDTEKKNPQDFAVWFFKTGVHKNALQYWESPFESSEIEKGYGFPGWHIECSAMAIKLLGETIDLHMGGIEHISIHHTNEIAQSECYTGKTFVNYWLHNEHLLVDGKKMSKSEGTSYFLSDVIDKGFHPLDLRYFFLQSHYRSKQNFTWEALLSAKVAYEKIIGVLVEISKNNKSNEKDIDKKYVQQFKNSLAEDFNVPSALAVLWEVIKSQELSDQIKISTIYSFDKVLGLDFENRVKVKSGENKTINPEAEKILLQREDARKNKDWGKSDELRDLLLQKYKVKVEDTSEGQKFELL